MDQASFSWIFRAADNFAERFIAAKKKYSSMTAKRLIAIRCLDISLCKCS